MRSAFGVDHGTGFPPLWLEVSKGYLRAVKGVAGAAAGQAKRMATTSSSQRLAQHAARGAADAKRGMKPYESVTRPMSFHPKARAAWEKGYRGG